jgi:hypothetical protein
LLDQGRDVTRLKHYSLRNERTYCDWIEGFIRFQEVRHPRELGEEEISVFLTHLARDGAVAASTQNQALNALLFLYNEVLKEEIGWVGNVERAKKPVHLRHGYAVRFSFDSVELSLEKGNKTFFNSLDPRIVLLVLGVGVSDIKRSPVASFGVELVIILGSVFGDARDDIPCICLFLVGNCVSERVQLALPVLVKGVAFVNAQKMAFGEDAEFLVCCVKLASGSVFGCAARDESSWIT